MSGTDYYYCALQIVGSSAVLRYKVQNLSRPLWYFICGYEGRQSSLLTTKRQLIEQLEHYQKTSVGFFNSSVEALSRFYEVDLTDKIVQVISRWFKKGDFQYFLKFRNKIFNQFGTYVSKETF